MFQNTKQIHIHMTANVFLKVSPFADEPKIIFYSFVLSEQGAVHNTHRFIGPSFYIQNFLWIYWNQVSKDYNEVPGAVSSSRSSLFGPPQEIWTKHDNLSKNQFLEDKTLSNRKPSQHVSKALGIFLCETDIFFTKKERFRNGRIKNKKIFICHLQEWGSLTSHDAFIYPFTLQRPLIN